MTTTTMTTFELQSYGPRPPQPSHAPHAQSPSSGHLCYTLPPPIPSQTARSPSVLNLRLPLRLNTLALRVLKVALATFATILTLVSGYWALDLAMYQATASFQQTCLQQMQTFNTTVGEACDEVVGKALEKPRAWRGYFAKGAGVVRRAIGEVTNEMTGSTFHACKDLSLVETEESSISWLSRWTAVKHYYAFGPAKPPIVTRNMKWEYFAEREHARRPEIPDWDDYSNAARTCIQKQADEPMLYGRLPTCNWQPLTSFESCWFDDERAMCEDTLRDFFHYRDNSTSISHANAMSQRRLDVMHWFVDDMDEMTLAMTSGFSWISLSKQWEMRDGRFLGTLVITVLVIELVDKIVRRRRSGW